MSDSTQQRAFVRLFVRTLFNSAWTYLAIGSTILTFLPLPSRWHKVIPFGMGGLFVISAYRAAWILQRQSEAELARLREEITRLKIRPYDEAQRKLVEKKMSGWGNSEKELLRFLLQHGPSESRVIAGAFRGAQSFGYEILTALLHDGVVNRTERQNPGRASTTTHWQVNSQFIDVLKDLLFQRNEPDTPPQLSD